MGGRWNKWTGKATFSSGKCVMNGNHNFCMTKIWKDQEQQLLHEKNVKKTRITTFAWEKSEINKNHNFCMGRCHEQE